MMKRVAAAALALLAVASAASCRKSAPVDPPLLDVSTSLADLRKAFAAADGRSRLVILVAPT